MFCAVWMMAGHAAAQPSPAPTAPAAARPKSETTAPTTVGEVVVQGAAQAAPKAFARTVRKFVQDQGRPGPKGQIARWTEPVCPMTAGLSSGFNDFVDTRIKQVAAQVGAPGSGACGKTTNVLVVFTARPDLVMADVRDHHDWLLGFHGVGDTRHLAVFEPPMKSWYVTVTTAPGFRAVDSPYAHEPFWGASHFPPPMQSHFAFVLVVLDSRRVEGLAIGQVADRIAFLALNMPEPRDGCSPLPSIMDLLNPACPSGGTTEGLTSYDEAYLKALYAYKGSELRYFERKSIARQIIRDASAAPSPDPGR